MAVLPCPAMQPKNGALALCLGVTQRLHRVNYPLTPPVCLLCGVMCVVSTGDDRGATRRGGAESSQDRSGFSYAVGRRSGGSRRGFDLRLQCRRRAAGRKGGSRLTLGVGWRFSLDHMCALGVKELEAGMCWLSDRDYCRRCWIVCGTTARRYLTLLSSAIGSCWLL